jgi:hypothetical protein
MERLRPQAHGGSQHFAYYSNTLHTIVGAQSSTQSCAKYQEWCQGNTDPSADRWSPARSCKRIKTATSSRPEHANPRNKPVIALCRKSLVLLVKCPLGTSRPECTGWHPQLTRKVADKQRQHEMRTAKAAAATKTPPSTD